MDNKQFVATELDKVIDHLTLESILKLLEIPKDSILGDVAFPSFSLSKKERKSPQSIATNIVEKVDKTHFEKVVATGPYVNFFLDKISVSNSVIHEVIAQKEEYGSQKIGKGRNITIDMSSPNIAKPFSIGHLRSTVIGDALSNLFLKIGYNTIKINHLGDWGKQFGMLITAYKKWGKKEQIEENPITELFNLYVRINSEIEKHPELDDHARLWFKKLENGDTSALKLWEWFRNESLIEFNRIYNQLNINFDSFAGESFYNNKMDEIIDIMREKNLLKKSKGAQIVDLDKYNLSPVLITKSDGATLYITRDLATALYRKRTYDFEKSIYVVGKEQSAHFSKLKAVLKEMGYNWSDKMEHVQFGLVTKNRQKLSTRKGNVILLESTIAEAIKRASVQIESKHPDLENKEEVTQSVGVGAIKFYDLKTDRMNGYDFNLETMLSFEGETGPYVQYAHARIRSILRKADFKPKSDIHYNLTDTESWEIIKTIQNFPHVIIHSADLFDPSILAKFTITLAQQFNKYYANIHILAEDSSRDSRLSLCYAIAVVLKEGLRILGVKAPNKM